MRSVRSESGIPSDLQRYVQFVFVVQMFVACLTRFAAFKSHSHLFKLSLGHAIAQSTKLSIYEAGMQESLALTSSFPKELSMTGHLELSRRDALKMTGRLFKLRMDVNLIGGILGPSRLHG
jgi:uncharacterized Rmd1/YagE family protein